MDIAGSGTFTGQTKFLPLAIQYLVWSQTLEGLSVPVPCYTSLFCKKGMKELVQLDLLAGQVKFEVLVVDEISDVYERKLQFNTARLKD